MTPPAGPGARASEPGVPRAVFSCAPAGPAAGGPAIRGPGAPGRASAGPATAIPVTLTRRSDFVRASRGLRQAAEGFHLQARRRSEDEPPGLRVGFTCSKKVGNAVARNRAKRRLRALARAVLPRHGREGWDYVLVGRPEATARVPMARMEADLVAALARVHRT